MIDVDNSEDLDMNELKDLLIKLQMESNLKTSSSMVNSLVQELNLCKKETQTFVDILLLPFKWTLSKKQFFSCQKVLDLLKHIRGKKKYRSVLKKQSEFLKFRMIESNIEKSVQNFEDLEKNPSKFICLNNDHDHKKTKINKIVSAIQLQFYLTLFPSPSKYEKKDPFLEDPIHTKPKVKCSISEPKRKIFCVESSGKRFDLNMTERKSKTYLDDPEWNFLKDWNDFRGESKEKENKFLPNIAGFIAEDSNISDNGNTTKALVDKNVDELEKSKKNIESNKIDININEINDFFNKIKTKRSKEII